MENRSTAYHGAPDIGDGSSYRRQRRPQTRAQNMPDYPREHATRANRRREQKLARLLMYAAFVVFLTCLFLEINQVASLSARSKRINTLERENKSLNAECENIRFMVAMYENSEEVREIAENRLGMSRPTEAQRKSIVASGWTDSAG